MNLLAPYVREGTGRPIQPTDAEIIEYARALCMLSGPASSLKELERIKQLPPKGLFVKAIALSTLWQYQQAVEILEDLIEQKHFEGVELLRVKTFLARYLIRWNKDLDRADQLLDEIITEAHNSNLDLTGWARLALQEKAKCALMGGRPQQCLQYFDQVYKEYPNQELPATTTIYKALIALAELALDKELSPKSIEEVQKAKDLMRESGYNSIAWIRRITMYEALIRNDRATLIKLYYTSPYDTLKERMLQALKQETIPPTYDLYVGPVNDDRPRIVIDLMTGSINGGKRTLKTGFVVQRLFWTLGRDPYYLFRFWDLFQEIFPDQRIGHVSAKGRLAQAVQRFRDWVKKYKLPIELSITDGIYKLNVLAPCTFIITDDYASIKLQNPNFDDFLINVKNTFGNNEFNTALVTKKLGIARRSAIRRLDEAVKAGLLKHNGTGSNTRYKLNT